jgi:hypothetical protein
MHKLLAGQAINLDGLAPDFRDTIMEGFATTNKRIWLTYDAKGCRSDFGTVFIVPDDCPDVFVADILNMEEGAPIFVAPAGWRMPQILKALGAFESTSQAAKNGWNKDVPSGFSQHTVRISHTKGCITLFKLPLDGMKIVGEEWIPIAPNPSDSI